MLFGKKEVEMVVVKQQTEITVPRDVLEKVLAEWAKTKYGLSQYQDFSIIEQLEAIDSYGEAWRLKGITIVAATMTEGEKR